MPDQETAVPVIMSIVRTLGGDGDPDTVVEALKLLADVIGALDPEAITEAVNAWLEEHPEVTVPPGSITGEKMGIPYFDFVADGEDTRLAIVYQEQE